ncbi:hypothetical protein ACFL27_03545 [candidate division CSSED10-310 bacterium]|uniref:SAM-dependent methyltransferase n=1 Tax=candidate division CSSED10-310 bacterium TaxID=2855610 RepID=A0ABV6YSU6_UNCC1
MLSNLEEIKNYMNRSGPENMVWYYLGIGIISLATLLMEVTMTRIFAVAFFNQFAFLIISTALFGFGFSGVFLTIFPSLNRYDFNKVLTFFSICYSVSLILTLKIVVSVPLQFKNLKADYYQLLYLAIYYLFLAIPFFFSGLVIALLLSRIPEKVNKLYFSDLIGAGLGCLLVIPLVPYFGAPGTIIVSALFGIIAAACFGKLINKKVLLLTVILFALISSLLTIRATYFRVKIHEEKRWFVEDEKYRKIEFSRWGPISRIDVAKIPPHKNIWIDGGTNQSFMHPFNGDLRNLQPDPRAGTVYKLIDYPDVLIVGPAGGSEVLFALSYRPNSIIGVELDPIIVSIVQNEYRDYIGGIYNQPMVKLINDEGRSYIRRSRQKFDIIQQIHNASPIAIASGAVNLSETYLLTVEAFHDYLDHLKEGGYIFIRRPGAIRLGIVAARTLRERGVARPEEQIIISYSHGSDEFIFGEEFYLKNGEFTAKELAIFQENMENLIFGPEALRIEHPFYEKYKALFSTVQGWKQYEEQGIDLFPVTDDKPFFNHLNKFGHFATVETVPAELKTFFKLYQSPDWALLVILGEAALLAVLFIIVPLFIFVRTGLRSRGKFRFLLYFLSLGLGFILIEIVFIQKFTLFMGNPTYSVTVVLFSVLISAGCGSLLSGLFQQKLRRALFFVIISICVLALAALIFTPLVFKACLGYPMLSRILISFSLIFPLGLFMGMPFPLGITLTNRVSPPLIPWVWAINGYATVIGSVLSVILALLFGFNVVIFFACGIYIIGLLAVVTLE